MLELKFFFFFIAMSKVFCSVEEGCYVKQAHGSGGVE